MSPDYSTWFKRREDVEKALYEGWLQHWLELWGFIGQQYLADCRYDATCEAIVAITARRHPRLDLLLKLRR